MTESQSQETGLPPRLRKLVLTSVVPSEYVLEIEELRSEGVVWFSRILDSEFKVADFLRVDDVDYLGFSDKDSIKKGRVYVRVDRLTKIDDEIIKRFKGLERSTALVLTLLFGSRNTLDMSDQPFAFSGLIQSEVVDITRSKENDRANWSRSHVVLDSLGGDTLLVSEDGKQTAWFQLETGHILETGSFRDAIAEYFRCVMEGQEYDSWKRPLR